ncbi:hypothetical protein L1887_31439 [Cichorium endivia]|nr:hypothetical protein L1887_31439 [Cichorium endivia]
MQKKVSAKRKHHNTSRPTQRAWPPQERKPQKKTIERKRTTQGFKPIGPKCFLLKESLTFIRETNGPVRSTGSHSFNY